MKLLQQLMCSLYYNFVEQRTQFSVFPIRQEELTNYLQYFYIFRSSYKLTICYSSFITRFRMLQNVSVHEGLFMYGFVSVNKKTNNLRTMSLFLSLVSLFILFYFMVPCQNYPYGIQKLLREFQSKKLFCLAL